MKIVKCLMKHIYWVKHGLNVCARTHVFSPMLILEVHIYFYRMMLNDLQSYPHLPQCLELFNSRTDGPNYLSKMQQTSQKEFRVFYCQHDEIFLILFSA